jgi:hypothetical protein
MDTKTVRPSNAKRFPRKSVGDFVWSCDDIADGASSYLIVRTNDDGYLRILVDDEDFDGEMRVSWAVDFHYETEVEALRARAIEDVEYCKPLLEAAHKILNETHSSSTPAS